MNAVCTDIATALTALLNGSSLSQTFTAVRCYVPNYDLAKSPGLKVFVVATGQAVDVNSGSREANWNTFTINVAVYKQVDRDSSGQPNQSQVDALLYFVQQVIDLLIANDIAGAAVSGFKNQPLYDPALLDTNNTFVSVLTVDYQLLR